MLTLHGVSYTHSNKNLLFSNIDLTVGRQERFAIVGNNGTGKSTLLRIIAGELAPAGGDVFFSHDTKPYYVPQHFGQLNHLSVAQALGVADRIQALRAIMSGDTAAAHFEVLQDDWSIEERCTEALQQWGLRDIASETAMSTLSGGQKTRILLAGISLHQAQAILLDEPTNHLDMEGRKLLYDFIAQSKASVIVVSHDRVLLEMMPLIYELSSGSLQRYGGSYAFYEEQKAIEQASLSAAIHEQEKALRKARQVARETAERQQKLDARGKKKQVKSGLPTISMNTLRNNAEKSTAKAKEMHEGKTNLLQEQLQLLRRNLPDVAAMWLELKPADLHRGKTLVQAQAVNTKLSDGSFLWKQPVSLLLTSGTRICIKGSNGSGKTTLVDILLGKKKPDEGQVMQHFNAALYVDQEYSLLNGALTVYEMAQSYNAKALAESEVKSHLNRFLFNREHWDKACAVLSGGEKMRLLICCLTLSQSIPELIVLDEPTNNLDLQNIAILTQAIADYNGTLIVISHDRHFLEEVGISSELLLDA